MHTFLHLKRTLNSAVDILVRSVFSTGIVGPLTDLVFGDPIKESDVGSLSMAAVEERMLPLLDYLTDQLTVLHSMLYSDVFLR